MTEELSKLAEEARDDLLSEIRSASTSASQQADVFQCDGSDCTDSKSDDQREKVCHDLLAVEELHSCIDDHGKDDPIEECPQDRQANNDNENRDEGSLDDGFGAVSHVSPAGNQSHYDTESADLFLELLGFGPRDSVILSACGDDFWHISRKPTGG